MSKNIENNKNLKKLFFLTIDLKKTDLKSDNSNWLIKKIFSKISRKA